MNNEKETLSGLCVEVGDDESGQPRLIIHTTREEIVRFRHSLVFAQVEIKLSEPTGEADER